LVFRFFPTSQLATSQNYCCSLWSLVRARGARGQVGDQPKPGRWQRTIGGCKYIRERRGRLQDQVEHAKSSGDYAALAGAWNTKMGLRQGDRVSPGMHFRWRGKKGKSLIKLGEACLRERNSSYRYLFILGVGGGFGQTFRFLGSSWFLEPTSYSGPAPPSTSIDIDIEICFVSLKPGQVS
jgi:hypothetical protein